MSSQITTAFVEQYSSNVSMLAQQMGSRLRAAVDVESVVGKNAFFDQIGVTAAQKKLFFNLRSLKGKLKALEDGDLQPELVTEIADRLDVSENDVIDMNRRLAGHDHSLNNPYSLESDEEWINGLPDERENHENQIIRNDELTKRKELLSIALKDLDERERRIITHRRLVDDPMTLDELSKKFGISRERVRQVEVKAFEKLRKVGYDYFADYSNLIKVSLFGQTYYDTKDVAFPVLKKGADLRIDKIKYDEEEI